MGTRSRIAVMHGDNCKSVYCHWDGYLEHNGKLLQEYYDSSKANNLVALGDISSLRKNIEIPEGVEHTFDNAQDDITVFYGRDRGETGTEWKVDTSFDAFFNRVDQCCGEWYYIMKDGEWYVGNTYERDVTFYKQLVPLTDALRNAEKEQA